MTILTIMTILTVVLFLKRRLLNTHNTKNHLFRELVETITQNLDMGMI